MDNKILKDYINDVHLFLIISDFPIKLDQVKLPHNIESIN